MTHTDTKWGTCELLDLSINSLTPCAWSVGSLCLWHPIVYIVFIELSVCAGAVTESVTSCCSSPVFPCFHQRRRRLRSFSLTHFPSSWSCAVFFQRSGRWTPCSFSCSSLRLSALQNPAGGRRHKQSAGSSSCDSASGWAPEALASFWTVVGDEPVEIQQWWKYLDTNQYHNLRILHYNYSAVLAFKIIFKESCKMLE